MHDGNDDTGGDWQQEASHDSHEGVEGGELPDRPEQNRHPLADNTFDVAAFFEILKTTGRRLADSPVLIALVGLTAISLFWALMTGGAQAMAYMFLGSTAGDLIGLALSVVGLILYPLLFLVTVAQFALYRPASQVMFQGGGLATDDPIEVIKSTFGILLPLALAYIALGFVTMIGLIMCVLPGLIAAVLFSQVPYLVAVRNEGVISAFKRSMQRTMAHWHIVAMAIGVNLIVAVIVSSVAGCGSVITGIIAPLRHLAGPVLQWLMTTTMVVVSFVVTMAAFGTIDELEGLDSMVQE